MKRILVVLPFYGGSLPVGRYCIAALRELGCLVDVFEAPDFYGTFSGLQSLRVRSERAEYLENSFLQLVSQAVLAKVESFEPDLVLCLAQAPLNRLALKRLRADKVPTAMWFVEDFRLFTYWRAFAPLYDVFAVIQKEPFFTQLAAAGVNNVVYLPMAASPDIHKPVTLSPAEKQKFGSDVSFMGAGYPNRRVAFRHLTQMKLKIWGTEWGDDSALAPFIQLQGQRVSTEDSVKIFNATAVNINLHSSVQAEQMVSHGDFVNPRTFELAACKAFQLVDRRTLLPELFADNELELFDSIKELKEKAGYYLAHPDERDAYKERAHTRVLADHTYTKRMRTLLDFVDERLPGRGAHASTRTWPESLPQELRGELETLLRDLALPAHAGFTDVTAAVRQKSGVLTPLETAVLFLDEWHTQYTR